MDNRMKAYCGTYCGVCTFKEAVHCPGCQACAGRPFWGECSMALCCIDKGLEHCGHCGELPCETLEAAFHNGEHGDDGARLRNLKNWRDGKDVFEKLR